MRMKSEIIKFFIIACLFGITILTGCTSHSSVDRNSRTESISPLENPSPMESKLQAKPFPYNIYMLNDVDGWAYGQNSKDASQMELLLTKDGGINWAKVMPENHIPYQEQDSGGSLPAAKVAFLDVEHFWVVKAEQDKKTVYITKDSGQSWILGGSIQSQGLMLGLTFVSPSVGWMTLETKRGLGYSLIEIYATKDSGLTWGLVASVENGSIPFEGSKTAPKFVNQTNGFIGLSKTTDMPFIYQTKDGGVTWIKRQLPFTAEHGSVDQYNSDSPVFFNQQEGIMEMDHIKENKENIETWFYSTKDGGQTWTPSLAMRTMNTITPYLLQYDFISIYDGWLTIDGETLYRSENVTDTWKPIFNMKQMKELHGKEMKITQLEFKTPQVGWALFTNTNKPLSDVYLYKTMDGGENWKFVDFHIKG